MGRRMDRIATRAVQRALRQLAAGHASPEWRAAFGATFRDFGTDAKESRAIRLYYGGQERITLEQLAERMDVDVSTSKRYLDKWVAAAAIHAAMRGLIREEQQHGDHDL